MAPTNNEEPTTSAKVEDADIQEMVDLNESLDELNGFLDFFEERADNMIEKLKELLQSNREIRAQLAKEQDLVGSSDDANATTDNME